MSAIHSTAVIHPDAVIHPSVEIGPYSVVEAGVTLGARCRVGPHVVLGAPAQVQEGGLKPGRLIIGADNWIREFVSVHAGKDGAATRLGHNNLLMAYSHVAHDCELGHDNELANGVQLAGHVTLGDRVGVGGVAAVHQFVRIGSSSFIAAGARVSQDVPPFCLAAGDRARVSGLNKVGLKRESLDRELVNQIDTSVRLIYRSARFEQGLAAVEEQVPASAERDLLLAFVRGSERGICGWVGDRSTGQGIQL